jgi:uncharacterized protein (TIGR02145 family)
LDCTDTLKLKDALGENEASLQLWMLGIRIGTLKLKQAGRKSELTYTAKPDTFELRILDEFIAFRNAHSDSFAKLGKIGASNLTSYYALQILSGQTDYTGYPGILPYGMKKDSVGRAIVALGPAFGLNSSKLANLGLGLDSVSIRVYMVELFVGGKLTATDTSKLFPRYPLRVISPVAVSGDLVPGGPGVPLSGSFSWNKGRIVSAPKIVVRTTKGIDPSFTFSAKNWPAMNDTVWSMSENVTISAPIGAAPGYDTLSVIVSSDSGYSIESRAVFRVVPRDTVRPMLRITNPGKDTTVANGTYSLLVTATASDSSGVDSVRIRNSTHLDAPYSDTLYLVVGENLVVVQAWDKFGNSSMDTVKITRTKPVGDTTAPKVVRIAPLGDTVVAWSTKTLSLSWTVTDDSALSRVSLNDASLTGAAGYYQKTVDLAVGNQTFVLVATDANGNARIDSLHVRRKSDTTGPDLRITAPSKDTSVPYPTSRILVAATATDSDAGLDSVKIGSSKRITAPFADSMDLASGPNRIVVQAWDKAGNRTEQVLVVLRANAPGDTTPPFIKPSSPSGDTSVAWAIKSFLLSYSISDDSLLSKVWINDIVWTGNAGVYQKSVDLAVGTNSFRVAAQDAHGNRRLDTLRIVRAADATLPVMNLVSPTKDTGVAFHIGKVLVSATATDLNGIDSIRIGGTTHASDAGSDSITLATGTNRILLQAWDKAGNKVERILVIEKAGPPGDTLAPVIKRTSPSKDTSVAWATKTIQLSYDIVDDSVLSKVWFNDVLWTGSAGNYQKSVDLVVGTNIFRVAAQDVHGNKRVDTLRIVRVADVTAPTLTLTGPTKDTGVAFNVGKILVAASASDLSGIDSIRIGGNTHASSVASDSIAVITGVNKILLQAWDKAGNRAWDTLRITRARDTVLPKIVRASGASEQVLSYLGISSISWTVTDNDSLLWVKIQGQTVQGSKNVYTASISAVPGRFSIVVEAADRAGNISADTVWWTGKLYDSRDRKSYSIATMPDGKIWMTEELAARPSWYDESYIDSFYTWSQAMGLPDSCDDAVCMVDTTATIQGVCPGGWHIPSNKEWQTLVDSAGIVHLKSATDWIWSSNGIVVDKNGDNQYGFNLRPRSPDCSSSGCTMAGKWWTIHQEAASQARVFYVPGGAGFATRGKWNNLPVRCLRN